MCALVTGVQTCALPICALAADAVVDRELELGAVAKHAVRARSPGLDDVPLLVAHRRPLRRELVAGAFDPPHVVAAFVDELHLQIVGRGIAADPERERVVFRIVDGEVALDADVARSEEHTSELQSLMRNSYAVFCLKKKKRYKNRSLVKSSTQRINSKRQQ